MSSKHPQHLVVVYVRPKWCTRLAAADAAGGCGVREFRNLLSRKQHVTILAHMRSGTRPCLAYYMSEHDIHPIQKLAQEKALT